ncbi:MAG TPA: hypothetical protein DIT09_10820 [Glutamicibacter sp.]|uniref:hypothetical protein n=1 Tax=Glutamicibacter arilaitensis TaxID=256701 RepID=UPI000EBD5646|nr:hypothetical protein [Glutamicibacter sp.]
MNFIIDGIPEAACDLIATSDGPIVRDTQEHAMCVYYMSSMKPMAEPYQDKKLGIDSATIDEDTAEVTDDLVNEEFKRILPSESDGSTQVR